MQPVATRSLKTSRTSVTEIYRIYSLCAIHVSFFKLLSAESFWAGLSEGFTTFAFHSITILSSTILFCPIQSTQVICCIVSWNHSVIIYIYIYPYLSLRLLPYHHSDLSRIFSQLSSPRFGSDLDFIYPLDASSSAWRLTPDEPEPTETPEQLFFNRAKVMGGLDITDRCRTWQLACDNFYV